MKRVLLLLANGFEVYEASVFIDVLGWSKEYAQEKVEVVLCGKTKEVTSTFGVTMKMDQLLDSVNASEFDALALPGGFETHGFYKDAYSQEFQETIQEFDILKKPINSICVGALPLGKAGILTNKKATTYNLSGGVRQKQLAEFGADVQKQPIVKDGNITTSWSPVTAIDVAFDLLETLTSVENADYIRQEMGF